MADWGRVWGLAAAAVGHVVGAERAKEKKKKKRESECKEKTHNHKI
jgi:hypothetical protein